MPMPVIGIFQRGFYDITKRHHWLNAGNPYIEWLDKKLLVSKWNFGREGILVYPVLFQQIISFRACDRCASFLMRIYLMSLLTTSA